MYTLYKFFFTYFFSLAMFLKCFLRFDDFEPQVSYRIKHVYNHSNLLSFIIVPIKA